MDFTRPNITSCTATEDRQGHLITMALQYQGGSLTLTHHAALTHTRPLLEMKRQALQQALLGMQRILESLPPAPPSPPADVS